MKIKSGFTFIEVLFAAAVLSVVFLGSITLIQFHRVESRKAMERAIMLDLAHHYIEILRSKPFYEILPGQPINPLYDGQHDSPQILIPADNDWQSLLSEDFRNFHPDLEWFTASEPEYRCIVTNQLKGSILRAKRVCFETRWKPPLGKGAEFLSIKLDTIVFPDFN